MMESVNNFTDHMAQGLDEKKQLLPRQTMNMQCITTIDIGQHSSLPQATEVT
jgi:hypothetical protein